MSLTDMSLIILLIFALFDVLANTRKGLSLSRGTCIFSLIAFFLMNRFEFCPTPELTLNAMIPSALLMGTVIRRKDIAVCADLKNNLHSSIGSLAAVVICTIISAFVMFLLESSEVAVIISAIIFTLLFLTGLRTSKLIILMVILPLASEILRFLIEVVVDGYGFISLADASCDVIMLSLLLTLSVHEIVICEAEKKASKSPRKVDENA